MYFIQFYNLEMSTCDPIRYRNATVSKKKGHKVIVSPLTAVKHRELNKGITQFNQTITELIESNDKVTFCENKNNRGPNFLEKDGVYINKFEGTKKLAGNHEIYFVYSF